MPTAEDTADERPPGRIGVLSPRQALPVPAAEDSQAMTPPDVVRGAAEEQARIGFIGKRLGRFLITAELGRGGMATVYRARDPQVGRDVAVKVMHGFFAGRAELEARFRREANAVAAIKHPSILALYDFAPPAGEEPGYIVSELIEGPGLRQVGEERGGRLWPEVAAMITVRVAEALGAAHAAGIVHRDVKPDNVMIDRSGGGARVVLTDFGVAHVSGMDTMTATGAVLGSPAYMSPEQARGEDVGPASDVFSLGVLMYQLCTGHLPFGGKDPLTVITGLLRGDYVRPAKLEARLGPDWERVITRCLARDPAARFPDGGAVAHALRELLSRVGISDEQAALSRYLNDPDAFESEVGPGIARLALAEAEQARRRRQLPRALAAVGRALAYAPKDSAAGELLNRLGSRTAARRKRLGLMVATSGVVIAGVFLAARPGRLGPTTLATGAQSTMSSAARASAGPAEQRIATTAASPGTGLAGMEIAQATATGAAPELPVTATRARSSTGPGGAHNRRKPHPTANRSGSPRPEWLSGSSALAATPRGDARADQAGEGDQNAPAAVAMPTGLQAPTASPPVLLRTASVVLRASHGFCEPSLDSLRPSLRASYNDLTAGPHEIYCTLPQGGAKVHVASYDLRAGTRPSLTIVPGPEGRPVLGRPE
ncbi:MAG: protein kinase [Myxococcales bacterium]